MSNIINDKFTEEEKQEILDYRKEYELKECFIGNDLDDNPMLLSGTTLLDILDQFYNNLFSK